MGSFWISKSFIILSFIFVYQCCQYQQALGQEGMESLLEELQTHQQKNDSENSEEKFQNHTTFLYPDTLSNLLTYDSAAMGKDYYPGISDPALDSAKAVNQALYRASFFYALKKGVKMRFLTDFYKKLVMSEGQEKFIHAFTISLPLYPMKPDSVYTNQFKETIVLAKPEKKTFSNGSDSCLLKGFIQEDIYKGKTDFTYRFELDDGESNTFILRMINNKYSLKSVWKGQEVRYPYYNYHYVSRNPRAGYADIDHKGFFSSNISLWPGLFGSLARSLFFKAKAFADYKVSAMSDSYKNLLDGKLMRQKGISRFQLSYQGMYVKENHIIPIINVQPNN